VSLEDLQQRGAQLTARRGSGTGWCMLLAREDPPPQLRRCRCPPASPAAAQVQDHRGPQRGLQGQGQTGQNGLGPRRGPHPVATIAAQGVAAPVLRGVQGW